MRPTSAALHFVVEGCARRVKIRNPLTRGDDHSDGFEERSVVQKRPQIEDRRPDGGEAESGERKAAESGGIAVARKPQGRNAEGQGRI